MPQPFDGSRLGDMLSARFTIRRFEPSTHYPGPLALSLPVAETCRTAYPPHGATAMKAMRRRTANPDLSSKYPLEGREMAERSPPLDRVTDPRPTTLEDQIDILRGLDQQRRISADLRDYGVNVLQEWIKDIPEILRETSARDKIDGERQLLLAVAAVDVLYRCCKKPTIGIETLLQFLVTYLAQDRVPKTSSAPTAAKPPYSPFLKNLGSHHLSLLLAAELMQALAAAPDRAYSKATLLCYYWIIREIYTADAPEWNIGGARAAPGGKVSAFITSKCVLSIVRFAHAQAQTAHFIDSLCAYEQQKHRLEVNNGIPDPYKEVEMERLRFSCYVALHRYGKTLALPFKKPESPENIDDYVRTTLAELKNTVKSLSDAFAEVLAEVDQFRRIIEPSYLNSLEQSDKRQEKVRFKRSKLGHERARSALRKGFLITKEIRKLLERKNAQDPIKILKKMASELRGAAEKVLKMLKPSQNFLSSVLNRELAAVSLGTDSTWVPHEMAFAAASLGILGKRWREDKRLLHAGLHLSRAMSDRGEFPFSRPFHSVKEELKVLYPASALRPFTELVRCVPGIPADLGIVKDMLRYFGETRMGQFGEDTKIASSTIGTDGYRKHGWFDEAGLQPHSFMPGPTIAAVRSLAAINRMLDERINHIILRHFRIKTPDRDLELELDALFYPDYGLRLIPATIDVLTGTGVDITHGKIFHESDWSDDLRPEESVAVTLQRMRAHVTRVSIPIDAGDRPFSVVLHGPPGTGKTTLVESLAKSCGVPFVEVTPSDIVVGGEEEVERRATAVFEALTLLTRVVILFDEFDPVLWKRDPTDSTPRSVFTFLTPGMLPKLKDLHRCAERRCCAYALVTNLIGGLDEAAVRDGRFDRKVGVYPPDPLSRTGRFLSQTGLFLDRKEVKDAGLKKPRNLSKRVLDVVKNTSGGAMETLGKPEWMTAPIQWREGSGNNLTPFAYAFYSGAGAQLRQAEREAHLEEPVGEGKIAIREFIQWWCIVQWDKAVTGEARTLKQALGLLSSYPKKDAEFEKLKELLLVWKHRLNQRRMSGARS